MTEPYDTVDHLRQDLQHRLARGERFVPIGDVLRVLACRCGNTMDLSDCRRLAPTVPTGGGSGRIQPIVCPACADGAA